MEGNIPPAFRMFIYITSIIICEDKLASCIQREREREGGKEGGTYGKFWYHSSQ